MVPGVARTPTRHAGREPPHPAREPRHAGRGRPFRRLARRPVAAALLCGGLLAAGGGTGGLLLLTGHPGISPRPVAHPGPPPAGVVAAPPRPVTQARASRPVYLSIPVIGVRTRLIRLGLTRSPRTRSQADPVTPAAASKTNAPAMVHSTAITLGLPSATANPM